MISEIMNPAVQSIKEEREHISVPRQGNSLESATETRAVHIRKAVNFLAESKLTKCIN